MDEQQLKPIMPEMHIIKSPRFLLAILIILLASVVGYFASAKYFTFWPFESEVAIPTFTPRPSPVQKINEVLNWKTYQNDKYGFELKYPGDWKVEFYDKYPDNIVAKFVVNNKEYDVDAHGQNIRNRLELISFELNVFLRYTVPVALRDSTTECRLILDNKKDTREISSKEILISGLKTKVYTLDNRNAYVDISIPPAIKDLVCLEYDNLLFEFQGNGWNFDTWLQNRLIINQILSTFLLTK